MSRADGKPAAPDATVVQVLDRRAQALQSLLLHDLLGAPQRHDVEPQAAPLEVEQLVEYERLRKTREAVNQNDEIDLTRGAMHVICPCQSVSATNTSGGSDRDADSDYPPGRRQQSDTVPSTERVETHLRPALRNRYFATPARRVPLS